jgi:hypothetical protein
MRVSSPAGVWTVCGGGGGVFPRFIQSPLALVCVCCSEPGALTALALPCGGEARRGST